jgi:hypothetical protein
MSRRRLALVAVAVVTVLCVVGVSIAAVAAGGQAFAYKVNGTRVSQSTVDDLLDDLADTKATEQASSTDGSIDARATAQVLNLSIARELLRDAAARRDVDVTDADRAKVRSAVEQELKGYPASYVDLVVDLQAHLAALGLTDQTQQSTFVARLFRRGDVYVNPRYGTWRGAKGVCPPTGCASLSTGSSS